MSYFAKKRLYYYKHLKLDVWGIIKNNLQYKIDKVSYNYNNIFYEAKLTERQGFLKKMYYKWNKFVVFNTVKSKRKRFLPYSKYIHINRVKSIFYFSLLFYFLKTTIKRSLYNIYKAFFFNKKRRYQKRFYPVPFIYEPRTHFVPFKRFRPTVKNISFKLVRLFYIIYSYKQLHRLIKRAKKSNDVFEQTFILLTECKLPSFIYRSSFFSNMFESLDFIKSKGLWINKIIVFNLYYTIKVMDFVGFSNFIKSFIFWTFFKRIRRKAFLFLFPKYMYISFVFFFIVLIRFPLYKEMINTVSADAYKISNYI